MAFLIGDKMKLKKNKEEKVYDTTISYTSDVPNIIPNIKITLGDMLMSEEVIINGITYIWVEGYKGVDKNMQSYNNFQYELDKPFLYEGTPTICSGGLHFCLNIKDTLDYYKFDFSNRYFKVKALVNKDEYLSYGSTFTRKHYTSYNKGNSAFIDPYYDYRAGRDDVGAYYIKTVTINKLSAKVIILTEEITKEDYFDYTDFVEFFSKYWIESKEELLSIEDFSLNGIQEYLDSKFITKAYRFYTPDFMKLYLKKYRNWENISLHAEKLSHTIKVIEACHKNGLTKDATTMIIMDEKL